MRGANGETREARAERVHGVDGDDEREWLRARDMPGLRTMCAKPRERETARIERCALSPEGKRGAAHIETCVLISEREAARSTGIKKCTRCEAARQRHEMYAVHTRGSARAQRETCTERAHQGMYAGRGCESSMICASRDTRSERERERMRATRTSGDVHGARLREQRHDVRIERCARFIPNKRERESCTRCTHREIERERERLRATHTSRDVRDARLREQRHDVRIERYAQSHPARERERLRATHTSRDVRDARLREQRHDVRIKRYAQFTPSEKKESGGRGGPLESTRTSMAGAERWLSKKGIYKMTGLTRRGSTTHRKCDTPVSDATHHCADPTQVSDLHSSTTPAAAAL
ncbi:hypothetical protein C8R46DRAFT_1027795 [Mycena filopes]|nr:hypothetical protein C8R46DRAFT_1027795 [Mycena filopes]